LSYPLLFQYPITNKEYPISKEGHFRLRSYGVTQPWAGCPSALVPRTPPLKRENLLFLLCYLGLCPRLLCYGLSALSAMNHRRYNLAVVLLVVCYSVDRWSSNLINIAEGIPHLDIGCSVFDIGYSFVYIKFSYLS